MTDTTQQNDTVETTNDPVVADYNETTYKDQETTVVYENKRVLAKRIRKLMKPIVYRIEEETLDEQGNVINLEIKELDESTLVMNNSAEEKTEQPVVNRETNSKIIKRRLSDLNPSWVTYNMDSHNRFDL